MMAGVAVTAALLVPLAIFGAPALARSGAAAGEHGSGASQYQYRVTICHLTGSKKHPAHTITVSSKAVAKHLRHGDHLGACTGTETPKAKHGKGHDNNGKGHDNNGKGHDADSSTTTTSSDDHGNGKGKGHHK
jgi:hypothetical protein